MKLSQLKTIDINAKEWRDKINGNSYFSSDVTLNYGMENEKVLFDLIIICLVPFLSNLF